MKHAELEKNLDGYIKAAQALPDFGFGKVAKIQTTVMLTSVLEKIIQNMDDDPYPELIACLRNQINFLGDVKGLSSDLVNYSEKEQNQAKNLTEELFEDAWVTFGEDTYDHSVGLIEKRFANSGLDKKYFKNKVCFDGGCGIGRLSVAIAKMQAKEVVAADLGGKSLDYLEEVVKRYKLDNLKTLKHDVTDLSDIESEIFDFVASYGVLHHTKDPIGGLKEHLRITRKGGELWLYLYGDGGFYWLIYDKLRSIISKYKSSEVKGVLMGLGLREGLVYTYLDNVLAPRTYHYNSDIIKTLEKESKITWRNAKGPSPIDDTEKCLATGYGKEILGAEGEVRLIITKL